MFTEEVVVGSSGHPSLLSAPAHSPTRDLCGAFAPPRSLGCASPLPHPTTRRGLEQAGGVFARTGSVERAERHKVRASLSTHPTGPLGGRPERSDGCWTVLRKPGVGRCREEGRRPRRTNKTPRSSPHHDITCHHHPPKGQDPSGKAHLSVLRQDLRIQGHSQPHLPSLPLPIVGNRHGQSYAGAALGTPCARMPPAPDGARIH